MVNCVGVPEMNVLWRRSFVASSYTKMRVFSTSKPVRSGSDQVIVGVPPVPMTCRFWARGTSWGFTIGFVRTGPAELDPLLAVIDHDPVNAASNGSSERNIVGKTVLGV